MALKLKGIFSKFKNMSDPAKASIAFVICSFMQRGISVLTTPIFTRLLTTDQYGYYSIFNSWLEIIAVFSTLKLAGGVFTQALVKFEDKRDELTASTAGLGTATTLLITAVYIPLRQWINPLLGMNTLIMLCILAASWATLMFELWSARQRVDYKYKALVALTLITSLAKPLCGIAAVLSTQDYKAEFRIVSLVLVELAAYTGLFVLFIKRGRTFFNKRFWKYSLSLNIPLIPHYLTRTVLNQSDRIMIQWMIGFSCAGIYNLAYQLAWMLSMVTNSVLNSFNPWMYQRIKKNELQRIAPVSYGLLILVAACGFGLIAIAPEIVMVFAPVEYFDARWVIPPVTASVYFLFMYSLFANFEFYFEKSNFMMIASVAGGVLNIILNLIFIQWFGYIAAGYTTLACYGFYAVAHYVCMRIILRKNLDGVKVYNLRIIIGISAAFLGAAAVMMLTYDLIWIRYAIILAALVVLLIKREAVMKVWKEIKKKD